MRFAALLALLLLTTLPATTQEQGSNDSTFNGLVNRVICYPRTFVICGDDYCHQPVPNYIGDWGGTLTIDLRKSSYQSNSIRRR